MCRIELKKKNLARSGTTAPSGCEGCAVFKKEEGKTLVEDLGIFYVCVYVRAIISVRTRPDAHTSVCVALRRPFCIA